MGYDRDAVMRLKLPLYRYEGLHTLFNMPAHATVVERLLSDSSSPPRPLLHELPARIPLIYAQVFTHLRSTLNE